MVNLRLLLPALALAACHGPSAVSEPPLGPAGTRSQGPGELTELEKRHVERAERALRQHDWVSARQEIDRILVDPLVAEARAHLKRGQPEEALVLAEQALEVAPNETKALYLHGEAALQVGLKLWDGALLEASLKSFMRVGDGPGARMGASRAAKWLQRTEDQLRFAREGMLAVEALGPNRGWGTGIRLRLEEWPERTLGQALHDRYLALRVEDPDAASLLVDEADGTLALLLQYQADDPWPWVTLSSLLSHEERFWDALEIARRGLEHVPGDRDLTAAVATAARGVGGPEFVLETFGTLTRQRPTAPLLWWYLAKERFELAIGQLDEGPTAELNRAEGEFRRCRELAPEHDQACRGYEVMCRDAVGWCRYNAGDLEGARAAFESMEELIEGGITYEISGQLLSGAQGLGFIGDAYRNLDDLGAAADVFLALHRYQPDSPIWANNAGFFHRDAADRLENVVAVDCERAARGELTDLTLLATLLEGAAISDAVPADASLRRDLFERAAGIYRERAQGMFEISYAAYLEAVRLAPDDVRVLNDCALIAVYHLKRDLERAEEYLLRSVELGALQLEQTELEGAELEALTEAWGDAHQNLGVLNLEYKNNPQAAREWFEKSLEIGPFPRPIVTEEFLPRCSE